MQADLHINFISLYASDEGKDFSGGSEMYHAITKLNALTKRKKKL